MAEKTFSTSTIVSLSDVMLSSRPKVVVEDALVKLLRKRLKELNITWDPPTFRKALKNPKLPAWILAKLENLIAAAEASGWRTSNALALELDETVEDIESFNPTYRTWLKKSRRDSLRDIRTGKAVSIEAYKVEVGL